MTRGFSRARLRGHRQGRRLSQEDLARKVGLEPDQMREIESFAEDVTPEQWLALAEALDVDVEELRCKGETWTNDYINVVVTYASPMSDANIAVCARLLHEVGVKMRADARRQSD